MKCLLLNSAYEGLAFISEIKGLKLYFNDKVEVLSNWDEEISWTSGSMKIPAVIKLKYYIKFIPKRVPFNRMAVFRRDLYACQYCNKAGTSNTLTIDHVIPKSKGGLHDWLNTVACCEKCNFYKDNRTPEEAGMRLINKPHVPDLRLKNLLPEMQTVHKDWEFWLK